MAQITILSGSLAGLVVPVGAQAFHIGRGPANDLEVPDASISRRHCVIEPTPPGMQARFRIRDLGSANGLRVNGHRAAEAELRSGARIQLGDYVLLFDECDEVFSVPDSGAAMQATVRYDAVQLPSFPAKPPSENLPETDRYSDDLGALLEISTECNRLHQAHALQDYFLKALLNRVPAEYAAAIPMDRTDVESCMPSRCQYAPEFRNLNLGISRTLVERARDSREAILFGRKRMEPEVVTIESVMQSRTESAIVVPAMHDGKLHGIVYLASSQTDAFDEHHLGLAAAAANILGSSLNRAFASEALKTENERLLSDIRIRHRLIGMSPGIRRALRAIQQVCQSDATVLIFGESGTGKELAAHAIHDNSQRRSGPMVAINCATFAETLIESELFGHERGAFSGAHSLKRGVFERAQNGTLFLDEIGELSLAAQAKLLRVIENRELIRLGAEKPVKVDFRLVGATHRSLKDQVKAGRFREDLFYRLNVFSFVMPALRERRQDIIPLAGHFLDAFRKKTSRQIKGFSPEAEKYMTQYDWPGNVRELRNAVERAVIAGASPYIEVEAFPETMEMARSGRGVSATYKDALTEARRKIILDAFRIAGGKHTKAAELLGVHPNNLHRLLKELDIRDEARHTQGEAMQANT